MNFKYSDIMFNCKFFSCTHFGGMALKNTGSSGYGISTEARKLTDVHSDKAKINVAAYVIEALCEATMNIASLPIGCYLEDSTNKITCDGNTVHCTNLDESEMEVRRMAGTALFCYAISNNSKMPITRDAFEEFKTYWLAPSPLVNITELVFKVCDAFYFEYKALVQQGQMNEEISIDEYLNIELIKQAARTGKVSQTNSLSGLTLPGMEILEISKEDTTKKRQAKNSEKFEACRVGEYLLDHIWDIDRQCYIPSLDMLDDFVPDPCFYAMTDLMSHELATVKKRMDEGVFDYRAIGENYINAQFIGRPGTGKTTVANALAATFGLPIRVIINSKNVEEDTFQGMTKVQEGGFKFVETPFLDAYKNGGIILLEEINLTDPGVSMGVLGQALEKPFILLEDGYKEVRRHPLCVVIGTANTGTQGSREQSEALTSRMPNVFLLDDPEKEQFIEILSKKNHNVSKKDCEKVYQAYTKVMDYLTSSSVNAEDVALSLCLRHCIAALKQIEIGIPFKDACTNTFVGTIGIKDLELARETKLHVIDILAD